MQVLQIPGYIAHCNLGTEIRGTAILAREGITLDDIMRAPSGRAIAAVYQGILLFYPDVATWWERCVLRHLKSFTFREMAERRADYRNMENHLYACIYDILNGVASHVEKTSNLNKYKATLIRLHARKDEWILLDQAEGDVFRNEQLSLFHVLKQKKRRSQRVVAGLKDGRGREFSGDKVICDGFAEYYSRHFEGLQADPDCVNRLVQQLQAEASGEDMSSLDLPITESEMIAALRKGAINKAPGVDGVGYVFYKLFWDTIKPEVMELINFMFLQSGVTPRQNHGIIINLPKVKAPETPADYRPITLLTTEYKLLTRIMAVGLQPLLKVSLYRTQFCGVPGNTILDAVAHVRDAIGYSESTHRPLCMASLDFQQAFDRISHQFFRLFCQFME